MRYEAVTKTKRNEAVKQYKDANPDLSLKEIGGIFQISKQRVAQIIKKSKEG